MYEATINGARVVIAESANLFSPRGADRGTLALLKHVPFEKGVKVLDLGCGCGIVGIYAAFVCGAENVVMCDIDPAAVAAARINAAANGLEICAYVSDGVRDVPEAGFGLILTNPPYQSDFSVAKRFIEKGFNRLALGGKMYMVTKRRAWYENKLRAVFGGCRVYETDGYFVFEAEKRRTEYGRALPVRHGQCSEICPSDK
ncbi:MAG: methyltransferase [Clostridia bacterium]|nr:methyltransferase [Clostridia bacterium]